MNVKIINATPEFHTNRNEGWVKFKMPPVIEKTTTELATLTDDYLTSLLACHTEQKEKLTHAW